MSFPWRDNDADQQYEMEDGSKPTRLYFDESTDTWFEADDLNFPPVLDSEGTPIDFTKPPYSTDDPSDIPF